MGGDIETNPGPGKASIYPSSIRSMVINCNGTASKKTELESVIDYTDPDVLIITETKIYDTVHTSELLPSNFKAFRKDRTLRGGGVKPPLVRQCSSIPGISDHYIVLTDNDLKAKKKAPHTIHLCVTADWDNLRAKTYIFSNNFLDNFNSRTVEQNSQEFSNHIKKVIIEHVPSKMTSSRTNLPWFTNSLKCMCNKKQRLYNKAKSDNNNGN